MELEGSNHVKKKKTRKGRKSGRTEKKEQSQNGCTSGRERVRKEVTNKIRGVGRNSGRK